MDTVVHTKANEIGEACQRRRVRRLTLFGSAAMGEYRAQRSDIDLMVEFQPMDPTDHADSYFGLLEDLQRLLGADVDLVERAPIRNPYFLEAIRKTQVVLYDAT